MRIFGGETTKSWCHGHALDRLKKLGVCNGTLREDRERDGFSKN